MQEAIGIRTAGRASFHHFLTSIGLCCKNDLLRISASQVYRCVEGVSMCISELYVLYATPYRPPPDAHKGHPYIWVISMRFLRYGTGDTRCCGVAHPTS